jgi:uncharacterized protein (TIGR02444 family)
VDAGAFWRFSLAFYARPGVADACLRLQDEAQVDINVMLYLLFLAQCGRTLTCTEVARIDQGVAQWRTQVVSALRTIRRRLKTPLGAFEPSLTNALRNGVKRIELDAEHLQQDAMQRLFPPESIGAAQSDRLLAARANLAAYGVFLDAWPIDLIGRLAEPLSAILAASDTPSSENHSKRW